MTIDFVEPDLLSIEALSRRWNGVSRKTIKALIASGDLKTVTPGTQPRITRASIENFMLRSRANSDPVSLSARTNTDTAVTELSITAGQVQQLAAIAEVQRPIAAQELAAAAARASVSVALTDIGVVHLGHPDVARAAARLVVGGTGAVTFAPGTPTARAAIANLAVGETPTSETGEAA
ncbi:MAG: helix-turn-helix domain-containing protein [Mycobacterium sp.]|nr:helix-turn-helix domain-containing protein [Mycobacterium sp.]